MESFSKSAVSNKYYILLMRANHTLSRKIAASVYDCALFWENGRSERLSPHVLTV